MKRLHVHVAVEDLADSVRFYSTLFGVRPSVLEGDYAKWMLDDPRVNFAISRRGQAPGLDHLGLQVESEGELREVAERLHSAGQEVLEQKDAACCYARSDKAWVADPQGVRWETFRTFGALTTFGEDPTPRGSAARCASSGETRTGSSAAKTEAQPAACCGAATEPKSVASGFASREEVAGDSGATTFAQPDVHAVVQDRYGTIARAGAPLPEAGCCGPQPADIAARLGYERTAIEAVPDGANLGLGCGAPLTIAALQPGETVLDLGSGAGFDAFLAAREVGPTGRVIGVDMTPEMLERARRNAAAGGYQNVEFREGRIEALPVEDNSVEVVISNCVINLVPDKAAVYREVARVLRPEGRVIISDIVLERPLPDFIAASVAAYTGCVAGAALREDYLRTVRSSGLVDVKVVSDKNFGELAATMIPDELREQAAKLGIDVKEVGATVRSLTISARKPGADDAGPRKRVAGVRG
ncbi:MAG TPA: ArsI/CadI family heavy metal resistance metalloenzyme [Myxococcota bacterium]|nr:ArsI/CadI family heavy metal resistance metalloenzyme [Myxococcota bacterium]